MISRVTGKGMVWRDGPAHHSLSIRFGATRRANRGDFRSGFGICSTTERDREIPFPCIFEVPQKVASEDGLCVDAQVAADDTEGVEKSGEAAAGVAGPFDPRTVLEPTNYREQIGGRKVLGIALRCEGLAHVGEHLHRTAATGEVEDGGEGGPRFVGPGSADEIGDMQQRFGAILLMRSEAGGRHSGIRSAASASADAFSSAQSARRCCKFSASSGSWSRWNRLPASEGFLRWSMMGMQREARERGRSSSLFPAKDLGPKTQYSLR